uniref:Uncharacterized protein n=1 Tax=Morchella brunnea TaxID=1174671 RepID=A0A8K1MH76_9PEZI|nr:hypothetical protein LK370_mgp189 [Morchella brunnea]UBU98371.1 hypothetical protein [Morchella brunnea]
MGFPILGHLAFLFRSSEVYGGGRLLLSIDFVYLLLSIDTSLYFFFLFYSSMVILISYFSFFFHVFNHISWVKGFRSVKRQEFRRALILSLFVGQRFIFLFWF